MDAIGNFYTCFLLILDLGFFWILYFDCTSSLMLLLPCFDINVDRCLHSFHIHARACTKGRLSRLVYPPPFRLHFFRQISGSFFVLVFFSFKSLKYRFTLFVYLNHVHKSKDVLFLTLPCPTYNLPDFSQRSHNQSNILLNKYLGVYLARLKMSLH